MTALMHSIILLEKKKVLYNWVIFLCLLTFSLSVMGTFFGKIWNIKFSTYFCERSSSRNLYFTFFNSHGVSFTFGSVKKQKRKKIYESSSKLTFILINNWFMIFFLVTVLIGTIYPIFSEVLINTKISVGPPYYNSILIPIIIPFLFLMAIGSKIQNLWEAQKSIDKNIFVIVFFFNFNKFFDCKVF